MNARDAFTRTDGTVRTVGANAPFWLDDPARAYIVEAGEILLFAVPRRDGAIAGARRYIGSAGPGSIMIGMLLGGFGILAAGLADSVVRDVDTDALLVERGAATPTMIGDLVDAWVETLVGAGIGAEPEGERRALDTLIEIPAQVDLEAGAPARVRVGVAWIDIESGAATIGATVVPAFAPLTPSLGFEANTALRLRASGSAAIVEQGRVPAGLSGLAAILERSWSHAVDVSMVAQVERLRAVDADDATAIDRATSSLASILNPRPPLVATSAGFEPLFEAARLVGRAAGFELIRPPSGSSTLRDIASASRVRTRRVELAEGWQHAENGPLLGTLRESGHPVALVPRANQRGYEVIDPAGGARRTVDDAVCAELEDHAQTFYRPFAARALGVWDVLAFGLRGSGSALRTIVALGLAGGVLATAMPLATGLLFGTIIPSFQRGLLIQVTLLLLVAAFASAAFEIARGIAVVRVQTRFDAATQTAVWDRLLTLPASFFREYSTGDLASRAMGIDAIRSILQGYTVSAILGSVFSIFSLALLFVYDLRLAAVGVGLAVVILGVTVATTMAQLRGQRNLLHQQGMISGLVLQFLTGISKLRVAGSEARAFSVWAAQFAKARHVAFDVQRIAIGTTIFNAGWPAVSTAAIIFVVAMLEHGTIGSGVYLAFTAAFGQFLAATLAMSGALASVLTAVPIFERAKPIFITPPEVQDGQVQPGMLLGKVSISGVTFRYLPDGPPTLDNVSIHADPGEFVAVVGPSGSGKSTLLRLLLGFERPESGSILYDDRDLRGLDVAAVRRQFGVVLQDARLMPGSIQQNIVGASDLGVDDAWEAARMVSLDEDIQAMPMGMGTHVSEGGSTFSGGQRQRLIIARAIVKRPRVVILDEATSALDNTTQAAVSRGLERMNATRIVIAHRLSTIAHADRIYVVVDGSVVQTGTYDELIACEGPFLELARRQLL